MRINKHDTNGTKPLLGKGELGYDDYSAGGDTGRVYVGTGSSNIAQAKKSEVVTVDGKVDTHTARVDNPHSVTKTQVGLSNVDNTSDVNKPVSTAVQSALGTKQDMLVSGTNIKTIEGQSIVGPGNIDLSKNDVGLSNVDNTADSLKVVASAGKWTTSRLINGTTVDGTVNITTSQWGASRNITIGSTAKSVNGSADTSWSLAEIGAIGTASPAFTGVPTAPTATVNTNTTQLATTAFVNAEIANDAIPRVTGVDTAIVKFDGVTGNVQASGIYIDSSDNVVMPKVSGGTTTITTVDGAGNTNLVLPESGTVATTAYVDGKISNLNTDTYQGSYGVEWNETFDSYRRVGASGYTAIQSLMKRCVLNADGSVNYYLDQYDSNLKEDGTLADLTGASGNVMVEVPLVYIKYTYDTVGSVKHKWEISLEPEVGFTPHWAFDRGGSIRSKRYYPAYQGYVNGGKLISRSGVYPTTSVTLPTFRGYSKANSVTNPSTGETPNGYWSNIDFALYELITLLCVIEYGTMNIQSALGQGRTALTGVTWVGGSLIGVTGLSNGYGNRTANYTYAGSADDANAYLSFMSYRGCENFFGNVWRITDGVIFKGTTNNKTMWYNTNPASYNNDATGYTNSGIVTASAVGYGRKLGNTNKGFIVTDVTGGNSNAGTTDYFYTSTADNTMALVGGTSVYGLDAGPLALAVSTAAALAAAVSVGCGVSF